MLAMLLATGLLIAVCFVLGQAVVALCGWERPQWWAPAVGYAVLLILFGQLIRLPNHQTALIGVAVLGVVAALALPAVRSWTREVGLDALTLGIAITLLASIPFFTAGYAGILGANVSNDMSQHLSGAWWLQHRQGMLPVAAIGGDLIKTGYPIGPHAVAAELSRALGLGEVRAFSAVTLAVPVLTGFIAFGIVPAARRAARWALALAVGLGYLMAAYLAQGQFKELILAMFVLAVAVALGDVQARERIGWRRPIPLAVLIGGSLYAYSYGGLLWIGLVVCFAFFADVFRRRRLFAVVRNWAPGAVAAAAVTALVVLPEVNRVRAFRHSIFGQESLRNKGNLAHALNPLESLGVWFNGDFRFNPVPRWPTYVFCALALAVLAAGLVWWWRRRSVALPAATAAAVLVWLSLVHSVNIYNAAKGLIVLAPLVMACIGAPLAIAWSARAGTRRGRNALWVVRGAGVVLFAGAAVASGGVLRSAPVGLGSHDAEFAQIRPLVRDKATLFLDNDHFAQWELRGARPLYTTNALYAPLRLGQIPQKRDGMPADADNFARRELDGLEYIVVSAARYQSEVPPNFRLDLRTPSYAVYRRIGATPSRTPLEPPGQPGTVLDCQSAPGKQYLAQYEWAGVLPEPIVKTEWHGSIARPGGRATMTVTLPRGRWDLSLQYVSATPATVRAPGLTKQMPENFGLITTYWPAGTLTSYGRPLELSVTTAQRTWFARLLGGPRAMRAPLSPGTRPLLGAAFTRHGTTPQRIPARKACGRYVDWFAPAGSAMRGRSGADGR
ncbi:MAG TPA: hypothetical protein VE570_14800 [Thermoleophilaceae bacterium]|nr:hypothetical protein [Thermoleophilaceae bacterium]